MYLSTTSGKDCITFFVCFNSTIHRTPCHASYESDAHQPTWDWEGCFCTYKVSVSRWRLGAVVLSNCFPLCESWWIAFCGVNAIHAMNLSHSFAQWHERVNQHLQYLDVTTRPQVLHFLSPHRYFVQSSHCHPLTGHVALDIFNYKKAVSYLVLLACLESRRWETRVRNSRSVKTLESWRMIEGKFYTEWHSDTRDIDDWEKFPITMRTEFNVSTDGVLNPDEINTRRNILLFFCENNANSDRCVVEKIFSFNMVITHEHQFSLNFCAISGLGLPRHHWNDDSVPRWRKI